MSQPDESGSVLLIDADGARVGVLSRSEAEARAEKAGLALVEVSPSARPPVVRLMDAEWSRRRNDLGDSQRDSRPPSKVVRLRLPLAAHEYEFKLRHVRRYVEDGHPVKVTVPLDGREGQGEAGTAVLKKMRDDLGDVAKVATGPSPVGDLAILTLEPLEES